MISSFNNAIVQFQMIIQANSKYQTLNPKQAPNPDNQSRIQDSNRLELVCFEIGCWDLFGICLPVGRKFDRWDLAEARLLRRPIN